MHSQHRHPTRTYPLPVCSKTVITYSALRMVCLIYQKHLRFSRWKVYSTNAIDLNISSCTSGYQNTSPGYWMPVSRPPVQRSIYLPVPSHMRAIRIEAVVVSRRIGVLNTTHNILFLLSNSLYKQRTSREPYKYKAPFFSSVKREILEFFKIDTEVWYFIIWVSILFIDTSFQMISPM